MRASYWNQALVMYQYCLLTQVFQKSLMVRYLVQFHNINHTSIHAGGKIKYVVSLKIITLFLELF